MHGRRESPQPVPGFEPVPLRAPVIHPPQPRRDGPEDKRPPDDRPAGSHVTVIDIS